MPFIPAAELQGIHFKIKARTSCLGSNNGDCSFSETEAFAQMCCRALIFACYFSRGTIDKF